MGGLWVDYNLMSSLPGLFVLGEANFSDHGANRLGASALMQGLADGYFVAPSTVPNYLASTSFEKVTTDHEAFNQTAEEVRLKNDTLLKINGKRTALEFHRALGHIMWDNVGMGRTAATLQTALREIPKLREEFWQDVRVSGTADTINQNLEYAGRVADFLEFGELLALDALHRDESCGGHFREEHQTPDGEAARNDEEFSYVAAWEYSGDGRSLGTPTLHKEELKFEYVKPSQRSYK
jgi:succinate dehydrogenase / fumarate reductase flavoprotein subunit